MGASWSLNLMIGMFLCSVPQSCRKSMKDDGVPPSLPIYSSGKFKGQVKGKGKGKDERMTIYIQSPKGEQATMYAYGSETLENVRNRLPIDPALGPYIKRDLCLMKRILYTSRLILWTSRMETRYMWTLLDCVVRGILRLSLPTEFTDDRAALCCYSSRATSFDSEKTRVMVRFHVLWFYVLWFLWSELHMFGATALSDMNFSMWDEFLCVSYVSYVFPMYIVPARNAMQCNLMFL